MAVNTTPLADGQLPFIGTFSVAATLCSFTATGKALGLSQAAISQRIQALEKALDTSLFDRRGGRVHLTAAGKRLNAYADQILDLHREARAQVTGRAAPVVGELRIAASTIPGEHLLPALLTGFGRKYPHVRVRASSADSLGVVGQVERGEVSIGLVGRKFDNTNLDFRFLAHDRIVVVAPPGHALGRRKTITVAQLARQPLILREAGSGLRHSFEDALKRAGWSLADFNVSLELGSNEAIKEAVRRGIGVAVLSTYAVRKEFAAGQLLVLDIKGMQCARQMYVVTDHRRAQSIPTRLFLSWLESHPLPKTAS